MRLPFLLFAVLLIACRGERAPSERAAGAASAPLLVFAASDLRDALGELAREYRAKGGDSATLVFGSTGELAAQIAGGAPADLFFAANADALDALQAEGLIDSTTRVVYAIGRLALIARDDSAITLDDLASARVRHIAIANPAHAPYGRAAREVLDRIDPDDRLRPKLVLSNTVSQAEQFVATGNADAGLVALSLAVKRPWKKRVMIDSALHRPLRQTAAVVGARGADGDRRGAAFLEFVRSAEGVQLLRRFGFETP